MTDIANKPSEEQKTFWESIYKQFTQILQEVSFNDKFKRTYEGGVAMSTDLSTLNDQQKNAVLQSINKNVVLMAAAGSGQQDQYSCKKNPVSYR